MNSNFIQAKKIQVSTDDSEVKAHLRQLGEPICKFLPWELAIFYTWDFLLEKYSKFLQGVIREIKLY
jgi:hypothetical protein